MNVSEDPTGPVTAPDEQGEVVLFGELPHLDFGIQIAFGLGLVIFACLLWTI